MPGKVDWLANGLPVEGELASTRTAGQLARNDVVTCALDDRVADVRARVEESPYGFALAVAHERTVLGRVRASAMREASGDERVEAVMSPGPSTVRYDIAADELAERLDKRDLKTAIVTTPEGRLVGVVRRRELERG